MASSITGLGGNPPSTGVLDPRSALATLFDANYGDIFGFCLARTGSEAAADEVASDTFMQAARWFADGRGDRVDRQWLFVSARSRLTDRWRRLGRERTRFLKLVQMDSPEHGIDEAYHQGDESEALRDRVMTVLGSLPERQRAALALRYLDERSVSEVADAMGVPYRTAESLLARGRRGFIAAWKEFDDER